MRNRFFIFLLSVLSFGCAANRNFVKKYTPSESPCLDGAVLNIVKCSCVSFFWGESNESWKLRCAYAKEDSWWNTTTFHVVTLGSEIKPDTELVAFCIDGGLALYVDSK